MKRIFINKFNLTDTDIDYEVIRVKAIVIDSYKQVIIIENNYTYQLPGGHKKGNEDLEDTLSREIREELGIDIEIETGPFLMITTYDNNYENTGNKVCNKIYYYVIKCDLEPNLNNLSLDSLESMSEFRVFKTPLDRFKFFLHNAIDYGKIKTDIGQEMLIVADTFNELYGGIL